MRWKRLKIIGPEWWRGSRRLSRPPSPHLNSLSLWVIHLASWVSIFSCKMNSFRLPITQDHCKSNRRVLAKLLRRKKWEPLTYSFNQRFLWTQGMPQTPSLAQGWGDGGGGGRSLRLTCCHQMGLHQIQEMHGDSYRRGERWPSPAAPAVK